MPKPISAKQAAKISGRSVSWLRLHSCGWCDQTALDALRYGCAAIWEKCDPTKRIYTNKDGSHA